MSPRDFSIEVIRRLKSEGFTAYWAGGCVRDLLRNIEPNDFDVATDAPPESVRKIFGPKRTLAVGESFGVMIVRGPKSSGQIEVATFRREGEYLDGRRPTTVEFCTAEEDAQRRDFTINGMFYDPIEEQVLDYVGGQEDLKKKIVRAIGDPHDRMSEDKLRMLRGVRFAATLGFLLDPVTGDAITQMASQIIVVSPERIAQEFRKMLIDRERATAMKLCESLNLLQVILPEVIEHSIESQLENWTELLDILHQLEAPLFETAFAVVLRDVAGHAIPNSSHQSVEEVSEICKRLKLSNRVTARTSWLVENRHTLANVTHMDLAKLKRLAQSPFFPDWLTVAQAEVNVTRQHLDEWNHLQNFLDQNPPEDISPPELIDGQDLIKMGLEPGPEFREILTAVRDAQLNNQISTTEEAVVFVKRTRQSNS
ncbi:Poly(A) polymerase I precursor [Thalassoglobus neptunius]|uniref:Poly(A) polymerase I n=1 Tax=Thalassoglobus neptunius TaxID=1938619 RepID=A0A5C5X3N6_9PLAN|nr:CCA tRNA nucleotidyltransferase [Thalassoglobus neptunius]TWT57189.1 Poly(A) polymerase I precursor [Thalassoglobus neptunius]